MSPDVRAALIQRVVERLAGCDLEFYQLLRMSATELDVLARLEHGWGDAIVHNPQPVYGGNPQGYPRPTPLDSQGCSPSTPQGGCGQVAA